MPKIKYLSLKVIAVAIGLSLSGCGGGASSSDNQLPSIQNTKSGIFIDAPVVGLYYETATQSGFTDKDGQFKYSDNEIITFKVGNFTIGKSIASDTITPYTITDNNETLSGKIAYILQSFDTDGNATNGNILLPNSEQLKQVFVENLNLEDINETIISDFKSHSTFSNLNLASINNINDALQNMNTSLNKYENKPDKINLKIVKEYKLPYSFVETNTLLDNDTIILAGGQIGYKSAGTENGSNLFSNKITKIDLINDNKIILDMNSSSVYGGRGNSKTYITKLSINKYLIHGGFQYVSNMEVVDFNSNTIINIPGTLNISGSQNGGKYFANLQGYAKAIDDNIYFFGYNDGLYARPSIIQFNTVENKLNLLDFNLTMPRSITSAFSLKNGKIIIIGGWDGTTQTTIDSATRRVEIFDPINQTIVRVTDLPEPYSAGQLNDELSLNDNLFCFQKYLYNIEDNNWTEHGYHSCKYYAETKGFIKKDSYSYSNYNFPKNYDSGTYIGKLSNGNLVFMKNPYYSQNFSDTINGYPIVGDTIITIFKQEN